MICLPRQPQKAAPKASTPATAPGGEHGARTGLYSKSDLKGTDSDYLCLFCYNPLYVSINAIDEVCFNRSCAAYANRGEISGDISTHEGPLCVRELCTKSVQEFYKFKREFLFRKLCEERARECEKLFRGKDINIDLIASIDYLLTRLNDNAAWGDLEDLSAYSLGV